ncbi:hypothetical protein SAMN05216381_4138 [Pseudomonas seleniipraecipitans]|jgi:hypothetical protein|uniref:Uncharacterized protein n=1 Tax=Phytopseudomonas seleniipraecipitans TaxID=640205 RepID=A0A1G7UQM3_9GAMM|nr:hypothetical protein SAMN05216381_4138 [Pseudomonas seleniipraecipitans]
MLSHSGQNDPGIRLPLRGQRRTRTGFPFHLTHGGVRHLKQPRKNTMKRQMRQYVTGQLVIDRVAGSA